MKMDWTRWTARDNQIYTWIGSHQWIKNQQTENTLRNKGIDYRDTIEGNGINHRTTKTAHWTDIAKGQCGVFKRVKAAYGHQTAVHRVHLPGIFITRKDKGRDEAESTEINKWNRIQKSTIGMVLNWIDPFPCSLFV